MGEILRRSDKEAPSGTGDVFIQRLELRGQGSDMQKPQSIKQKTLSESADVPEWLTRSVIYKRVPIKVRRRLDAALLKGSVDNAALQAIAADLKLSTYGVSVGILKKYAVRLEQWVRPSLTAQLLAGVLGCLPEDYRRQLVAGSQVLLLSRVIQALSSDGKDALPAADLAKLASILSALGISTSKAAAKLMSKGTAKDSKKDPSEPPLVLDKAVMAKTVRELYGLNWPPAAN